MFTHLILRLTPTLPHLISIFFIFFNHLSCYYLINLALIFEFSTRLLIHAPTDLLNMHLALIMISLIKL